MIHTGRHFLQIPGPTNVPDRVLRAMAQPTIDHRGPEFGELGRELLARRARGVQDDAAGRDLPGVGHRRLGGRARQHAVAGRPRADGRDRPICVAMGANGEAPRAEGRAAADRLAARRGPERDRGALARGHARRRSRPCASCTTRPRRASSSRIASFARRSIRQSTRRCCSSTRFPRSLRSTTGMDAWGVDVTVGGSQKGLMLPPGLELQRDLARRRSRRSKTAKLPRSFWGWDDMLKANKTGYFPYTPATNLLYGLREALAMLARGGARERLRSPRATRRSDSARGPRVGPRGAVPRADASTAAR